MRSVPASLAVMCGLLGGGVGAAQEATAGVDVRATVSQQVVGSSVFAQTKVDEPVLEAGVRSVVYPTVKFNEHWTVTGAFQTYSRPYFYSSFTTPGYGNKGTLLQGTLNYSRVSDKGSVMVRAGVMSSAFGSFLLRYDDTENALADLPPGYGYYYAPVSIMGIAAAQVDATRGKWDGRVQFANSSPANPRSVFAADQYGNWAGGAGYTVRQGLRVGWSAYRGPYLDRHYKYFYSHEGAPNTLPAHAIGTDVEWAHGHWNVLGEFARFTMPYSSIPVFHEDAGYVEVKRVLNARWYVAAREGYTSTSSSGYAEVTEFAGGLRTGRFALLKMDYEMVHHAQGAVGFDHTVGVQFIVALHAARAMR